jgi:hypothetical protein
MDVVLGEAGEQECGLWLRVTRYMITKISAEPPVFQ